MSEFQYLEFAALDKPLSDEEMAEVRRQSTRATITATRFHNVYHWGRFKGDPQELLRRYYDAFLYRASWGTREFSLRVPSDAFDAATLAAYGIGSGFSARRAEEYTLLRFVSDDHPDGLEADAAWFDRLLPVRAELTRGDKRALYLGFLTSALEDEGRVGDDTPEPPVPPGLGALPPHLLALARFLRIDDDLLAVAAEASMPLPDARMQLTNWIRDLDQADKDECLVALLADPDRTAMESERIRRRAAAELRAAPVYHPRPRKVGDLLKRADERHRRRKTAG